MSESASDWHGWGKGGVSVHVGKVPGRKQACLYSMVGSTMQVHAYFRNEDEARIFLAILDYMAGNEMTAVLERLLEECGGSTGEAGPGGNEQGAARGAAPQREAD